MAWRLEYDKYQYKIVVLTEVLVAVPHGSLLDPVVSGVPESTSSAGLTDYLRD